MIDVSATRYPLRGFALGFFLAGVGPQKARTERNGLEMTIAARLQGLIFSCLQACEHVQHVMRECSIIVMSATLPFVKQQRPMSSAPHLPSPFIKFLLFRLSTQRNEHSPAAEGK